MNAIEVKNVTKSFPGFKLDCLNLDVEQGTVLGLVGENGAGKSTTIKLLLNILQPDAGSIRVFGKEPNQPGNKEDIGVVFDEAGFPSGLNTLQIGKVLAASYKNWDEAIWRKLLNDLNLPLNKPFSTFSRGMRMKLSLAAALSHKAKLLLLDEATAGLDPLAREQILDILFDFTREENHSIVLSSHIVSDLEKICDTIAFLHKGKLLINAGKDELLEDYCIVHCSNEELKTLDSSKITASEYGIYGNQLLMKKEDVPADFEIQPVTLEELFIMMAKEK